MSLSLNRVYKKINGCQHLFKNLLPNAFLIPVALFLIYFVYLMQWQFSPEVF